VSLDGVIAPRKEGKRQAKRHEAGAQGKAGSGSAGSQEVGWAPGSYDDRDGERLVRRMARMPEAHQATLKTQGSAAVMGVLLQRPD
jgi:hypothetical protein